MALQAVACPYRRASCHRYGMPCGKTWPVLWFSSMITRILVTRPWPAPEAGDDGGPPAAEAADAATDAGAVLVAFPEAAAPAPQPAARQPTSPVPISRATQAGLRTHPTVAGPLVPQAHTGGRSPTRAAGHSGRGDRRARSPAEVIGKWSWQRGVVVAH